MTARHAVTGSGIVTQDGQTAGVPEPGSGTCVHRSQPNRGRVAIRIVALASVLAGFAAAPAGAAAATLYVSTSGLDSNPCAQSSACKTISHAVSVAAPGDTIDIAAGTYIDLVTISAGPITIQGASANSTSVSSGSSGTVLTVAPGVKATITDLTIAGGSGSIGGGPGGVSNAGNLTLQRVIVTHNVAGGLGLGGGVYNTGTLEVDDSTISDNEADQQGGGIDSQGGAVTLKRDAIIDNTLTPNVAPNSEGPRNGGGIGASGASLNVFDSTVADNVVPGGTGYASSGGGIGADVNGHTIGHVSLVGDTVAGNDAPYGGGVAEGAEGYSSEGDTADTIIARNQGGDCFSGLTASNGAIDGYNLDDDGSCFGSPTLVGLGDQVNVDPRLGPLADNGGPTQTMALSSGSPAIAYVPVADCHSTDQRGQPRPGPNNGATFCDIGAYEYTPPSSLQVNPNPVAFGSQTVGSTQTKAVTITNTANVSWTPGANSSNQAGVRLVAGGSCDGTTLAPGNSCTTIVSYDPQTAGAYNATITINSNFPTPTILNVTGSGVNAVQLNPNPVAFGSQTVGTTKTQTVTITNPTNTAWTPGANSSNQAGVRLVAGGSCDGTTLAPGNSCTTIVSYDPQTAGAYNATITINSNFANPTILNVTGTGI